MKIIKKIKKDIEEIVTAPETTVVVGGIVGALAAITAMACDPAESIVRPVEDLIVPGSMVGGLVGTLAGGLYEFTKELYGDNINKFFNYKIF